MLLLLFATAIASTIEVQTDLDQLIQATLRAGSNYGEPWVAFIWALEHSDPSKFLVHKEAVIAESKAPLNRLVDTHEKLLAFTRREKQHISEDYRAYVKYLLSSIIDEIYSDLEEKVELVIKQRSLPWSTDQFYSEIYPDWVDEVSQNRVISFNIDDMIDTGLFIEEEEKPAKTPEQPKRSLTLLKRTAFTGLAIAALAGFLYRSGHLKRLGKIPQLFKRDLFANR